MGGTWKRNCGIFLSWVLLSVGFSSASISDFTGSRWHIRDLNLERLRSPECLAWPRLETYSSVPPPPSPRGNPLPPFPPPFPENPQFHRHRFFFNQGDQTRVSLKAPHNSLLNSGHRVRILHRVPASEPSDHTSWLFNFKDHGPKRPLCWAELRNRVPWRTCHCVHPPYRHCGQRLVHVLWMLCRGYWEEIDQI